MILLNISKVSEYLIILRELVSPSVSILLVIKSISKIITIIYYRDT